MKCPSCAADVTTDSTYCPKCGQRLDAQAAAPPKTPVEQFKAAKSSARAADVNDVEMPLWKGGFSWKAMISYWLLAVLATIAGIVIGVVGSGLSPVVWYVVGVLLLALWGGLILYYLYQRLSVEYELTNQRLVHRHGILTRVTDRIEVIDIDDVQFTQGIIERLLGVGTIRILSSDVSHPKFVMRGIDDVKDVFALVDNARRDERRKRGMYIETV